MNRWNKIQEIEGEGPKPRPIEVRQKTGGACKDKWEN
jgi:hypothetical protein